jgi:hypothetical protein
MNLEHSKTWFRFIDDIFLLWTHDHDSLFLSLECFNNRYPVQFIWAIYVTFHDINIHVDKLGFCTSIHFKPTYHQQYLHFSSYHPLSTKHSILYSQAICGRHIFNHPNDLSISLLLPPLVITSNARFTTPNHRPNPKPAPFAL